MMNRIAGTLEQRGGLNSAADEVAVHRAFPCAPIQIKKPLVSIVISNYSYGSFLRQAIDSALSQTYHWIEVIVVDDGSTDDSRAIIESYGGRIRAVFKANGGQASAYNAGFAVSRGELILFLDADDLLDPEAIEECVRLCEPGVASARFYLRIVVGLAGTPTNIVLPTSRLAEGDVREQTLRDGHHVSPPSSGNVYTREALAQLLPMPEEEWRIGADTYCIFLSSLIGEIRASNRVLGCYRVHGNNNDLGRCDNVRERLEKELARDQMFTNFCAPRGMRYSPGAVANQVGHLKLRLASLLIDPQRHIFPRDQPLALAWRTVQVAVRSRQLAWHKKLMVIAWVVAFFAAPRNTRLKLFSVALLPTRRFRFLNRALSPAKSSRAATLASSRPGVNS